MAYYIETSSKQSFDKTIETTVAALAAGYTPHLHDSTQASG